MALCGCSGHWDRHCPGCKVAIRLPAWSHVATQTSGIHITYDGTRGHGYQHRPWHGRRLQLRSGCHHGQGVGWWQCRSLYGPSSMSLGYQHGLRYYWPRLQASVWSSVGTMGIYTNPGCGRAIDSVWHQLRPSFHLWATGKPTEFYSYFSVFKSKGKIINKNAFT